MPSNEDRGYILRRIMRRTMQQGHALGIEQPLPAAAVRARGRGHGRRLSRAEAREWPTIERWARAEEESFGRTLAQGERLLPSSSSARKAENTSWVSAEDAFRLHDTYGFPYEMTKELLAEEGLSVDDQGFEELMEQAREVSRAGASSRTRARAEAGGGGRSPEHEDVLRFAKRGGLPARASWATRRPRRRPCCARPRAPNGWMLAKLEESPFYPEGGGQVSDTGLVETPSGRARVVDVYRLGDDQALALEPVEGEIGAGESARARRRARARGSRRCATTPPRTSCTPRCASGSARTCARPAPTSGRTSCASTSPTASGSAAEELRDVEGG